jgi:L-iditol 2-dehydrogenase
MVSRGGLVNLFGGCASGTQVTFATKRLHYDEITLVSLFHHTPDIFETSVRWMNEGLIDASPLITERMGLSQLPEALELIGSGKAIKVAIHAD